MGITRNFKNLIMSQMVCLYETKASTSASFDDTCVTTFKSMTGTIYQFYDTGYSYGAPYSFNVKTFLSTSSDFRLMFGTGNTQETFEDYKLANEITLTQVIAPSTTLTYLEDGKTIRIHYKMTASYSSDVSITELGFQTHAYGVPPTSGSKAALDIMIYRKVLDTPIELEAGVPSVIEFDIDVPIIEFNI